jgi:hypothetical protein
MTAPIPERIQLVTADQSPFQDRKGAEKASRALERLGFTAAGTYTVTEMPGIIIRGFVDERSGALATLSEHPAAGQWIDILLRYEGGCSLTVTNVPFGGELDHMPGHERILSDALDPEKLLRLLLDSHDGRPVRKISPGEFPQTYVASYEEYARWRLGRGVTEDEVRRTAEQMDEGISEFSIQRAARRYQDSKLTREEAFACLRGHAKLPASGEVNALDLARYQDLADYFIQHPDRECLPMWLGAMRADTAEEFGLLVSEVLAAHERCDVVASLQSALLSPDLGVTAWAAQFANDHLDPALHANLERLTQIRSARCDEGFHHALTALRLLHEECGHVASGRSYAAAMQRCRSEAGLAFHEGDYLTVFNLLYRFGKRLDRDGRRMLGRAKKELEKSGVPAGEIEEMYRTLDEAGANLRRKLRDSAV